jgi:hypothetical protein
VAAARAAPVSWGRMASSSPWITSTGQRTRPQAARKPSASTIARPRTVSASVAGPTSAPHETASSRALVEWASLNIWPKKKSRKPR